MRFTTCSISVTLQILYSPWALDLGMMIADVKREHKLPGVDPILPNLYQEASGGTMRERQLGEMRGWKQLITSTSLQHHGCPGLICALPRNPFTAANDGNRQNRQEEKPP